MRIVAFPYHDWRKGEREGMRWRDGHLIEHLSCDPKVDHLLVIDRPVSMVERLVRRVPVSVKGRRVGMHRVGFARGTLTRVADRITVLDVTVPDLTAPIRRGYAWWFDVFERPDVLDLVAWASKTVLGSRPAAVAWMPTVASAVERLDPSVLLFDSLDNWLLHPLLRKYAPLAARGYGRLIGRADLTVVSAPRSRDALAQWSSEIEIVPNGVSPSKFSGHVSRPDDLPKFPVVGYAGSLGPRIDVDLVTAVARSTADASFVFIGQALDHTVARELSAVPNIHVLGDRHYSLVPAYLRSFDVAWIPHAIGAGESGGDPIKMYEYWAAGREVVSTRIDGLHRWSDKLHLVDDAADATATIRGLLDGSISPRRATVPEERTWEAIAAHFVRALESSAS